MLPTASHRAPPTLYRPALLLTTLLLTACAGGGGGDGGAQGGPAKAPSDGDTPDSPPIPAQGPFCAPAAQAGECRVLFVGNSYTGFNELSAIVQSLSESPSSERRLVTDAYWVGGYSWSDHENDGNTGDAIDQGWDAVVLQDHSTRPWAGDTGAPGLAGLADRIEATGARITLFMTWGREGDAGAVSRLRTRLAPSGYYYAQDQRLDARPGPDADVAPVGRAWERAGAQAGDLPLYQDDGSHPSIYGSYLAACVFYASLTGASPVGLDDGGTGIGQDEASRLQRIAWRSYRSHVAQEALLAGDQAPLLGAWSLAARDDLSANYLPSDKLRVGGLPGPDAVTGGGTRFVADSYIALPYHPSLSAHGDALTLAIAARRDDWSAATATPQVLFSRDHGLSSVRGPQFELSLDGTTLSADFTPTSSSARLSAETADLSSGWHHFALSYERDAGRLILWIDGQPAAETALAEAVHTAASPIILGARAGDGLNAPDEEQLDSFIGGLADFRLYGAALPAATMARLAEGGVQP